MKLTKKLTQVPNETQRKLQPIEQQEEHSFLNKNMDQQFTGNRMSPKPKDLEFEEEKVEVPIRAGQQITRVYQMQGQNPVLVEKKKLRRRSRGKKSSRAKLEQMVVIA